MGFSILDSILSNAGVTAVEENNTNVVTEAEDDDFSIDTSLDDSNADDASGDTGDTSDIPEDLDEMPGDDTGAEDTSSSGGDFGGSTEEDNTAEDVIEDNKDMFSSLTAEEQKIKIMELKRLFNLMYTSLDDISIRLSNIDIEEYNYKNISKLTTAVYDLKTFVSDYVMYTFDQKSYYENDVAYNRFMDIIHDINIGLDKMVSEKEKYEKEEQK